MKEAFKVGALLLQGRPGNVFMPFICPGMAWANLLQTSSLQGTNMRTARRLVFKGGAFKTPLTAVVTCLRYWRLFVQLWWYAHHDKGAFFVWLSLKRRWRASHCAANMRHDFARTPFASISAGVFDTG